MIIVFIAIAIIAGIHIVSMLTLDKKMEYTEEVFYSDKLPKELDGYTFAFVSDTHNSPPARQREIVEKIRQRNVDSVFFGGDMVGEDAIYTVFDSFGSLQTADGMVGVEGNHDFYPQMLASMQKNGATLLYNSGISLRNGLYVAGVQDAWTNKPNVQKAIAGAKPDDFVILISHNPDVSMEQDTTGVHLMLSGHIHGGQVRLFGLWAPALTLQKSITRYGQRFMEGWTQGAYGTAVYTSRGIVGSRHAMPRIFCPPQVVFITLKSQP